MITDRNFSITDRPPARLPSGTLDSIAEDQEEEPVSNSRPRLGSFYLIDDPVYDCIQDFSAVPRRLNGLKKSM